MIEAGHQPIVPVDESSCYRMENFLQQNGPQKTTYQPPSPSMKLAEQEFEHALSQYDDAVVRIAKEQQALRRSPAFKQRAKALGIVVDDGLLADMLPREHMIDAFFADSYRPKEGGHRGQRTFSSPGETRAAAQKVQAYVGGLHALYGRICDVSWLAESVPDVERMLFAVASRVGAIEDRVTAVKAAIEELRKKPKASAINTKKRSATRGRKSA
jgi:hypothetical protein